jgi:hypothetical protein
MTEVIPQQGVIAGIDAEAAQQDVADQQPSHRVARLPARDQDTNAAEEQDESDAAAAVIERQLMAKAAQRQARYQQCNRQDAQGCRCFRRRERGSAPADLRGHWLHHNHGSNGRPGSFRKRYRADAAGPHWAGWSALTAAEERTEVRP